MGRDGRGFTMLELAAALGVVGVVAAMLLASLGDARRNAGLGRSISNLKRYGVGVFTYASDSGDMFPAFSWTADEGHSDYADLELMRQSGGLGSSVAQAQDIIRRRGPHSYPPLISAGWALHAHWNHLPLLDHLGEPLLSEWVVTPADEYRLGWQRDPFGCITPSYCGGTSWRWVYSSSYETPPTFWQVEGAIRPAERIRQLNTHNTYAYNLRDLQSRRMASLRYPSQKAMVYERYAWYFGRRQPYVSHREARLPVLAGDGAVAVRATGDAGPGWIPTLPDSPSPTTFSYQPREWEPATMNGQPGERVTGHIRWTRWGALGRDWGGPEVDPALRAGEGR